MSKLARKKKRNKQERHLPSIQSRIPTIAIIGPRNGQEAIIEKLCGGIARLKFVDARNSIYLVSGGITGLVHRIRLKAAKIFLLNTDFVQKNKTN